MHNRSDQFCKNVLRDALSLAAAAETEVEVLAATQKIDVYSVPDPTRQAERARMGLLGELAAVPCMFEPYHDTLPRHRGVTRIERERAVPLAGVRQGPRSARGRRTQHKCGRGEPCEGAQRRKPHGLSVRRRSTR